MQLTDLHDNKITYDQNAGYKPIGTIEDNLKAQINKAMADSLRNTLEQKAPSDIPVKQFNAELEKQYKTADYLDALNGKKVPETIGSRIRKTAGKVVGAAVGTHLGGGVLGGVGGYHIGGMVESMLENMPSPIKNQFLDNLSRTNPEAFDAMTKYMTQAELDNLTRKQLPAPKYIPLNEKTPSESYVKGVPAQKGLVGRSPQTGKFFGNFKSTIEDIKNNQGGYARIPGVNTTSLQAIEDNIKMIEKQIKGARENKVVLNRLNKALASAQKERYNILHK